MITGKSKDSLVVNQIASAPITAFEKLRLDSGFVIKKDNLFYKKNETQIDVVKVPQASGIIQTAKDSVDLSLSLVGIMALFMGIMAIAEKAGGIRLLSKIIGPFFSQLFPDLPKNHPAMGHMMMNFSANLLGLDNAATTFGLKAME
ncbi:MAG: spore maturation protein, partial [Chitinophagaceae bacterium]|nr:spore maturation protein [Chitinophagaceae bacterium]